MFDAYTVKKVLPRLVIAAILIQLSWPIFTFMIQAVNQVAWGVEGIMYAPFGGRDAVDIGDAVGRLTEGGSTSVTTVVGGGALAGALYGGLVLGPAGLFALFITVLIALFIVFVVLAMRQAVLVGLLVLAPLALVAWILPGTEKFWKIWWESFSKLLLMYPLILLLIASGRIFALIAAESFKTNGSTPESFGVAIVILIFFAPFFLIPKTFQLAGSAFANIAGIANNRSRGAFDRLKNYRQQQSAQRVQKMQSGTLYSERNRLARGFNRTSAGLASGVSGRFGLGTRGEEAVAQSQINAANQLMQDSKFQAISQRDDVLRALTYNNRADAIRGLQNDFGMSQRDAEAAAAGAAASVGFGRASAIAASKQLINTGTGFANMQQMVETFSRASNGSSASINDLAGFANSATKRVGRHDLAPGYSDLASLTRRQAGLQEFNPRGELLGMPTAADFSAAQGQAYGSADPTTLVRDKSEGFRNHVNTIGRAYTQARNDYDAAVAAGDNDRRADALRRMESAEANVTELKGARMYATTDNAAAIDELEINMGENRALLSRIDEGGRYVPFGRVSQNRLKAAQSRARQYGRDPSTPGMTPPADPGAGTP